LVRRVEASESLEDLHRLVEERNDFGRGGFVKAVRRYATTCSCGELRLLLALCAAVDFAHVADDLAGGRAWQDMTAGCDLRYRTAIAACILGMP
jgi:hypothetical protein